MAQSLCCSTEIMTTLLTGYIPIQKKKIKVKKKKTCKVSGQADVTLIPADDANISVSIASAVSPRSSQ